jgi:two-component system LytT family response regulator
VIRALIVDDEPLGRQGVRTRLAAADDVRIVGEACDGAEAVEKIVALLPDLVFLDIQMPEMDGFQVLARVAERHLPCVVFISAFDRFALQAFEVHALDYLLKPWSLERFEEAMRRARAELGSPEAGSRMRVAGLLDASSPAGPFARLRRFVVRDRERFVLLPVAEVDWIRAAENYVELHARGTTYLVRHTMKELARSLDPGQFARIHRSVIVRIDRIQDIRAGVSGDYQVTLVGGQQLPMSRTQRHVLITRG